MHLIRFFSIKASVIDLEAIIKKLVITDRYRYQTADTDTDTKQPIPIPIPHNRYRYRYHGIGPIPILPIPMLTALSNRLQLYPLLILVLSPFTACIAALGRF